jgi:hypothetical protein
MTTFTVEATFGDQMIRMQADGHTVDEILAEWNARPWNMTADEIRVEVRQLVVNSLMNETHRTVAGEDQLIAGALVWLTATGSMGEKLLPFMRRGGIAIGYDITRLTATGFNFRLLIDEKTQAALDKQSNSKQA